MGATLLTRDHYFKMSTSADDEYTTEHHKLLPEHSYDNKPVNVQNEAVVESNESGTG